jgi:hypothetical protein
VRSTTSGSSCPSRPTAWAPRAPAQCRYTSTHPIPRVMMMRLLSGSDAMDKTQHVPHTVQGRSLHHIMTFVVLLAPELIFPSRSTANQKRTRLSGGWAGVRTPDSDPPSPPPRPPAPPPPLPFLPSAACARPQDGHHGSRCAHCRGCALQTHP